VIKNKLRKKYRKYWYGGKWHRYTLKYRKNLSKSVSAGLTGKKYPHLRGSSARNWKGNFTIHGGYVSMYCPDHPYVNGVYVAYHRFVVEQQIGRYLLQSEPVHHINRNRADNRLENLMAFSNHSSHMVFHWGPDNVKPEDIIFDGREYNGKQPIKIANKQKIKR
jgi:hypothetical protein